MFPCACSCQGRELRLEALQQGSPQGSSLGKAAGLAPAQGCGLAAFRSNLD